MNIARKLRIKFLSSFVFNNIARLSAAFYFPIFPLLLSYQKINLFPSTAYQ
jgi:ABC-type transport system involved in cytochrome bd biosynthesis fused ATPase/permease subunit